MRRTCVLAALALGIVLLPSLASANVVVRSGQKGWISRGVFELGFDNVLLLSMNSIKPPEDQEDGPETSTTNLAWNGGFTARYFLMKNLSLSGHAGYFLEKSSQTTKTGDTEDTVENSDGGFIFTGMVHYYLHMSGGMFFKPGIGGGWFQGTRKVPVPGTEKQNEESTIAGPVARVDLGLVYYAGPHFNLKAGPDLLVRIGKETPEEGEGPSFTRIDAGFNVGVGWSF